MLLNAWPSSGTAVTVTVSPIGAEAGSAVIVPLQSAALTLYTPTLNVALTVTSLAGMTKMVPVSSVTVTATALPVPSMTVSVSTT